MVFKKFGKGNFFRKDKTDSALRKSFIESAMRKISQVVNVPEGDVKDVYNAIVLSMCKTHPNAQSLMRKDDGACIYPLLVLLTATLSKGEMDEMGQYLTLLPAVVGDIIIKNAVREGKEKQLLDAIEQCRRAILPQQFPYFTEMTAGKPIP